MQDIVETNYAFTKEQYETTKSTWKSVKEHQAYHHIVYNLIRSKPADLGFKPCVSERRKRGGNEWYAFKQACSDAQWTYFKHLGPYYSGDKQLAVKADCQERFKKAFGIDLPDNLNDLLDEARKLHV